MIFKVLKALDVGRLKGVYQAFAAHENSIYLDNATLILGITKPTLYSWIDKYGLIKITGVKGFYRIEPTHLFYAVIDIISYIENYETSPNFLRED